MDGRPPAHRSCRPPCCQLSRLCACCAGHARARVCVGPPHGDQELALPVRLHHGHPRALRQARLRTSRAARALPCADASAGWERRTRSTHAHRTLRSSLHRTRSEDRDLYDFKLKCGNRWTSWSGLWFKSEVEDKEWECPSKMYVTGTRRTAKSRRPGSQPPSPPPPPPPPPSPPGRGEGAPLGRRGQPRARAAPPKVPRVDASAHAAGWQQGAGPDLQPRHGTQGAG